MYSPNPKEICLKPKFAPLRAIREHHLAVISSPKLNDHVNFASIYVFNLKF